jgi:hypothetical protein
MKASSSGIVGAFCRLLQPGKPDADFDRGSLAGQNYTPVAVLAEKSQGLAFCADPAVSRETANSLLRSLDSQSARFQAISQALSAAIIANSHNLRLLSDPAQPLGAVNTADRS